MPIYEYSCSNCNHLCEFIENINASPSTTCPNCNQETLQRQISASAFHLKGSGWYVTDFKDKKTKNDDGKVKETESAATNETSVKGDADASVKQKSTETPESTTKAVEKNTKETTKSDTKD